MKLVLLFLWSSSLSAPPWTAGSTTSSTTGAQEPFSADDWASLSDEIIEVRAERPRATASTTIVRAEEFRSVPRRTAEDALRLVPGLSLVQHGSEGKGHQFFLRGFDAVHGADLEVTVDGIPVNEWSNIHAQGYVDLGFVIPEVVHLVEVTKGPFTLEQGPFAMAGSAHYRLGIAPEDRGWRATYSAGTTNRHRGLLSYSEKDGAGDEFFALETAHDDGFGSRRGLDRGVFLGRLTLWESQKFGRIQALASAYHARFELPGVIRLEDFQRGFLAFDGAYDDVSRGASTRGMFGLFYGFEGDRDRIQVSAHGSYRRLRLFENYTGFLVHPDEGDRRSQSQSGFGFGIAAAYSRELAKHLRIDLGLGLRGDHFDQQQTRVDPSDTAIEDERFLRGLQTNSHAFAGFVFQPADALDLRVGLRGDVARVDVKDRLDGTEQDPRRSGTLVAISPRATLAWRVLSPLRMFASYGRGYRPPEARAFTTFRPARRGILEDVYEGGEPANTSSDAFEVGARWSPSRSFAAALSGFLTLIERESVFDHVSGINLELNGTRRIGGELSVQVQPVDWLGFAGGATFVDARFVESGNRVPLAPGLTANGQVVLTHSSGVRGGLRVLLVAPRPLPHSATGEAHFNMDLALGYVWEWLRVDVEVENILNRRLREGEYHFASDFRRSPTTQLPVLHYVAGPPLNLRVNLTCVF